MLVLPRRMRSHLGRPLGILFRDEALWERYASVIQGKNVATVGDIVTYKYIEKMKKPPQIAVVDGRTKRSSLSRTGIIDESIFTQVIELENPPGNINLFKLRAVFEEASLYYPEDPVLIKVKGEEDLLLIPLLTHFGHDPKLVALYGQPGKGVVLITVPRQKMPFLEAVIAYMRTDTPLYS